MGSLLRQGTLQCQGRKDRHEYLGVLGWPLVASWVGDDPNLVPSGNEEEWRVRQGRLRCLYWFHPGWR